MSRPGKAGLGMARHDMAGYGKDSLSWWRLRESSRRGEVRSGEAPLGEARLGKVRQGEDSFELVAATRISSHGKTWRGAAW
jgi:hypothetical protein